MRGVTVFAILTLASLAFSVGCGEDLELRRPRLVRPGSDGNSLVIFDYRGERVMVADRTMKRRLIFTHPDFSNLWGLDADSRGIVVANQRSLGISHSPQEKKELAVAEVMRFDYDGNLTGRTTWTGETGPTVDPRNIMIHPDGSLYIGDIRKNCLVCLDSSANLIGTIATYGFDPGFLFYPNDTRLTPDGNLLVVDAFNSRLQLFGPDGTFRRVVAESGEEPGLVRFPQVAAFDREGNLYCTELSTGRVSVFDSEFRFQRALTPPGSGPCQLFGICVLENPREVFVCDILNSRIIVFDPLGKPVRVHTRLEP